MKPKWVLDVITVQDELYRISKMFEMLWVNTADEKLRGQAKNLQARCCNLGMRYLSLGNKDALYLEDRGGTA